MSKFYIIPPPVIVEAVQFRKNKKLPESEYYKIHQIEDRFIFECQVFQKELVDKEWIVQQSDKHLYITDDEYFKKKFKKIIDLKEPKSKSKGDPQQVIDIN